MRVTISILIFFLNFQFAGGNSSGRRPDPRERRVHRGPNATSSRSVLRGCEFGFRAPERGAARHERGRSGGAPAALPDPRERHHTAVPVPAVVRNQSKHIAGSRSRDPRATAPSPAGHTAAAAAFDDRAPVFELQHRVAAASRHVTAAPSSY